MPGVAADQTAPEVLEDQQPVAVLSVDIARTIVWPQWALIKAAFVAVHDAQQHLAAAVGSMESEQQRVTASTSTAASNPAEYLASNRHSPVVIAFSAFLEAVQTYLQLLAPVLDHATLTVQLPTMLQSLPVQIQVLRERLASVFYVERDAASETHCKVRVEAGEAMSAFNRLHASIEQIQRKIKSLASCTFEKEKDFYNEAFRAILEIISTKENESSSRESWLMLSNFLPMLVTRWWTLENRIESHEEQQRNITAKHTESLANWEMQEKLMTAVMEENYELKKQLKQYLVERGDVVEDYDDNISISDSLRDLLTINNSHTNLTNDSRKTSDAGLPPKDEDDDLLDTDDHISKSSVAEIAPIKISSSLSNLLDTNVNKQSVPSSIPRIPSPASVRSVRSMMHPTMSGKADDEASKNAAAVLIQSVFKGYMERRLFQKSTVRRHVWQELLSTEISYVNGLISVHRQYYLPLRLKSFDDPPIVIRPEQFTTLFFQLTNVLNFNKGFMKQIELRFKNWTVYSGIGDLFMEQFENLKNYTLYVNNYTKATAMYQECLQNPAFKSFIQDLTSKQDRRALGLLDYLIMPVQRIPRYMLMIKELIKKTPRSHPDFENINNAYKMITEVTEIINESKRAAERFSAADEIFRKISGIPASIVRSDKFLVNQGDIFEQSASESGKRKPRYLFLLNDMLICCQPGPNNHKVSVDKATYEYKWSAPLTDINFKIESRLKLSEDEKEFSITVIWESSKNQNDKKTIIFSTEAMRQKWWELLVNYRRTQCESSMFSAQIKELRARNTISRNSRKTSESDVSTKAGSEKSPSPDVNETRMNDNSASIHLCKERIAALTEAVEKEKKMLAGFENMSKLYQQDRSQRTRIVQLKSDALQRLQKTQDELNNQQRILRQLEDISGVSSPRMGKASPSNTILQQPGSSNTIRKSVISAFSSSSSTVSSPSISSATSSPSASFLSDSTSNRTSVASMESTIQGDLDGASSSTASSSSTSQYEIN